FIGKIAMKDFLKPQLTSRAGQLLTSDGTVVGTHEGAQYYTVGQRHGIGYGGGDAPYYVTGKDIKKNIVTVAKGRDNPELFREGLVCSHIHWISGTAPKLPFSCRARIRYRQPLQRCRVKGRGKKLGVLFDSSQRAVTPGQSIVFYKGLVVLGGGIIE
ncbi:MAG: aminomethyltransferase beta-barrel domain-containing protein, partial [Patescibacteria group bacterium]